MDVTVPPISLLRKLMTLQTVTVTLILQEVVSPINLHKPTESLSLLQQQQSCANDAQVVPRWPSSKTSP